MALLQCSQLCIPTRLSLYHDIATRRSHAGAAAGPLRSRPATGARLFSPPPTGLRQVRFAHLCRRDIALHAMRRRGRAACAPRAVRNDPKPTFLEMTPITSEAHFDEVLESGGPVIIDWMATWCRKCIYLRPKLEKLAAEYHPEVKFYCVDVNAVPAALVSRANVTKMPTIQFWKNKERAAEVIGGDQAWLVMDKIREMLAGVR